MHAFWYYIVTEKAQTDSIQSKDNMFNKMLVGTVEFISPWTCNKNYNKVSKDCITFHTFPRR